MNTPPHILVGQLSVMRADETVALTFQIEWDQLKDLTPGEPVTALACFEELRDGTRISRALSKAVNDAAAAKVRKKDGDMEDLSPQRRQDDPSEGTAK